MVSAIKSDRQIPICGDYKFTISKYLEDFKHPVPLRNEFFAFLQWELYTKLDFSNAYNHLVLHEDSQLLCAGSIHMGIFKMTYLPFTVEPVAVIFEEKV